MENHIVNPHVFCRELRDAEPLTLCVFPLRTEEHRHSLARIYRFLEPLHVLAVLADSTL
jgi:hypothetical protein